jgi:hypothetical protein
MSRRRTVGGPPRQSPYKRTYADGRVVWIARAVDLQGRQRYVKPRWNGGKSTFASKRDAQRAIDEELALIYGRGGAEAQTIETYLASWLDLHPRSQRTNESHANRISYVLGVEIDGRPLRDWEFDELRRRHVLALVDHMFRVEGRAAGGARGTLASLSAMKAIRSRESACAAATRGSANPRGRGASSASSRFASSLKEANPRCVPGPVDRPRSTGAQGAPGRRVGVSSIRPVTLRRSS